MGRLAVVPCRGEWLKAEQGKGGLDSAWEENEHAGLILCLQHTITNVLLSFSILQNCVWGNQERSRSFFISTHFQGE